MRKKRLIKTPAEIGAMRQSGRINAQVLQLLAQQVEAGMTTKDLAKLAADEVKKLGGKPSFLGFQGYPDVICINVNEQLQHAIPNDRELKTGDVVNFDFGVTYDGMITDAGITVGVGQVSANADKLITATREALDAGIAQVHGGGRVGDISATVEQRLRRDGLGVVEDLIGHGVGHSLHEEPGIPNYGTKGTGKRLLAGMTIAIEPIATLGGKEMGLGDDGWTFYTADGSWSAQFEHTVLVTEAGSEVLSKL